MAIIAEGKFYRVLQSDTGVWAIWGIPKIRSGIGQEFTAQEAADLRLSEFREGQYADDHFLVDERCREILSTFLDEGIFYQDEL
jgi:hypothetical protein